MAATVVDISSDTKPSATELLPPIGLSDRGSLLLELSRIHHRLVVKPLPPLICLSPAVSQVVHMSTTLSRRSYDECVADKNLPLPFTSDELINLIKSDDHLLNWSLVSCERLTRVINAPLPLSIIDLQRGCATLQSCVQHIHDYVMSLTIETFRSRYYHWFDHTPHASRIIRAFELHRNDGESGVALAQLATYIERYIGNLFAQAHGPSVIVPAMLRDLLAHRSLHHRMGNDAIALLSMVIGPPTGLNLRNIVWHGFVAQNGQTFNEANMRPYTSLVFMVFVTIAARAGKEVPPRVHTPKGSDNGIPTIDGRAAANKERKANGGAASSLPTKNRSKREGTPDKIAIPAKPTVAPITIGGVGSYVRPLKDKYACDIIFLQHAKSRLFCSSTGSRFTPLSWLRPESASSMQLTTLLGILQQSCFLLPNTCDRDVCLAVKYLTTSPLTSDSKMNDNVTTTTTITTVTDSKMNNQNNDNVDRALTLLIPAIEHSLRRLFVALHQSPHPASFPPEMITAQSVVLFTTLDVILAPTVEPPAIAMTMTMATTTATTTTVTTTSTNGTPKDNDIDEGVAPPSPTAIQYPNQLWSLLGAQVMHFLSDLLQYRPGVRLRDRLAHGECAPYPSTLKLEYAQLLVALCVHLSTMLPRTLSTPTTTKVGSSPLSPLAALSPSSLPSSSASLSPMVEECNMWFDVYQPVFHPRSHLFRTFTKLNYQLLRLTRLIAGTSSTSPSSSSTEDKRIPLVPTPLDASSTSAVELIRRYLTVFPSMSLLALQRLWFIVNPTVALDESSSSSATPSAPPQRLSLRSWWLHANDLLFVAWPYHWYTAAKDRTGVISSDYPRSLPIPMVTALTRITSLHTKAIRIVINKYTQLIILVKERRASTRQRKVAEQMVHFPLTLTARAMCIN
jgi:hypothetical protein